MSKSFLLSFVVMKKVSFRLRDWGKPGISDTNRDEFGLTLIKSFQVENGLKKLRCSFPSWRKTLSLVIFWSILKVQC